MLNGIISVSFTYYLWRRDNSDKMLMRLILPAFCIWGFGYSMDILYGFFGYVSFSVNFMIWLDAWWHFIESACLCWLVMSYSWILFQQLRKSAKPVGAGY